MTRTVFTPDVIENGLTKELMEDKIIEKIKGLVVENEEKLAKEAGLDISKNTKTPQHRELWISKRGQLFDAFDGEGGIKFVEIYQFNNLL